METSNHEKKVAVAMSGGVDSSVAAYLLKKQGYDVAGFFMRNWSPLDTIENVCPWQKDYEDVRKVCRRLGIPHGTFNFEEEYKKTVLDNFLAEYQAGRTPNPDVLCNKQIKFDAFARKAFSLGFDYIATGHYAKLEDGRLLRPKDSNKDQTYFLCRLTSDQLRRVIFPLQDLTKAEVRDLAIKAELPNARKKDSQGICFIGKISVREFLKSNLKLTPGQVVTSDGKVLGSHEGAELYTIGQRHIGVSTQGEPLYVTSKNANTIVMDREENLYKKEVTFSEANWMMDLPKEFNCDVQLRYRTKPLQAHVDKTGKVTFSAQEARAVTPGQYIAFFKSGALIGSAKII